jgi:hypothetical protein
MAQAKPVQHRNQVKEHYDTSQVNQIEFHVLDMLTAQKSDQAECDCTHGESKKIGQ